RTADSGYLTRRLVDVAQEVIVREDDCETDRGIPARVTVLNPGTGEQVRYAHVDSSVFGRVLAEDVKVDRKKVASKGDEVDDALLVKLVESGAGTLYVRTVLTCDAVYGVCRACYGRNLA